MYKRILAAALVNFVLAAPSLASEEYQDGPTRPITGMVVAHDVGSEQTPDNTAATVPANSILVGNSNLLPAQMTYSPARGNADRTGSEQYPGQ